MNRWFSIGLVAILGFLLGMLGFSLWNQVPIPVERVAWSSEVLWIGPQIPTHRFYARRTIYLPDTPQAAWLRISGDNDFVLYVNDRVVDTEFSVLDNTQGLAAQFTSSFQQANDSISYRVGKLTQTLTSNAKDWKLTNYIDLSSYLRAGKNVVAMEIHSNRDNPRVVVEGKVYPVSNEELPISLSTGSTDWRVSSLAESYYGVKWFETDFSDYNWSEARVIGSVQQPTYSRVNPYLFDRFLQGNWISGIESPKGEIWLRKEWQVLQKYQRAYIRFAGEGKYSLLLNNQLLIAASEFIDNQSTDVYEMSDPVLNDPTEFDSDAQNNNSDNPPIYPIYMYDVTNLLHKGVNTLVVHLTRPLNQSKSQFQQAPHKFFLDGWTQTKQGQIDAEIATNGSWLTSPQSLLSRKNTGLVQSASLLDPPQSRNFSKTFEGDAYLLNYPSLLLLNSIWRVVGIGISLVSVWSLGHFSLDHKEDWWSSLRIGTALLMPGTFFLIGIGLLKHRHAQTEQALLFVQPQSNLVIVLCFLIITFLTWAWSQRRWCSKYQNKNQSASSYLKWQHLLLLGLLISFSFGWLGKEDIAPLFLIILSCSLVSAATILFLFPHQWLPDDRYIEEKLKLVANLWQTWGKWLFFVLVIGLGCILRVYNLEIHDPSFDENVSLDTVKGILRTGAPSLSSDIWYTRSPLYHYLLALWLQLMGNTLVNARLLSVLFGLTTLVFAFILAYQITGKFWVGLVTLTLLAIDPWAIMYSRMTRFYQLLQLGTLISHWAFFKGFIESKNRAYQYFFLVALTLTILSQEVAFTLLPGFLLGFIFFYRPFHLLKDWPIVLGGILLLIVGFYDVAFFSFRTLTPFVVLGTTTDSIIKPHLSFVTDFLSTYLVGPNRMYTLLSFFSILGFIYVIRRQDSKYLFFFFNLFLNLIVITILVRQIANRYLYFTYPIFVTLSTYSAISIVSLIGQKFEENLKGLLPLKKVAICFLALLFIGNLELGRILEGYQGAIFEESTQVFEYIEQHRQSGDVVISSVASGGAMVLDGLDYYLAPSLETGAIYRNEGQIIDRWSGGVVITNLDQMSRILEKSNRVWLYMSGYNFPVEQLKETNPKLGAFFDYLETFGQPILENFGGRLYLWQRKDGQLPRVPNEGKDLGEY